MNSPGILALFGSIAIGMMLAANLAWGENPIIQNGDFEKGSEGWAPTQGATIVAEDGNQFFRLEAAPDAGQVQVYRKVSLPTGFQSITVSFRVRYSNLTPGAESWHTGRVIMHFKDAEGNILKPDPQPFVFKGDSDGWVEKSKQINIPEGATSFELMPALFQVASGTLDIDDISVVPSEETAP